MRAPILALALILGMSVAACGGKTEPGAEAAPDFATLDKAKVEEMAKAGDEAAKAELEKRSRAEQKAAFEAAMAANDTAKIEELAGEGNGWALHHQALEMLKSDVPPVVTAGFTAMEEAAAAGNPDAQLWVGQKMAYGIDGYPWKPNSGMIMIEKAANQGHVDAMYVLGELYAQDQPMQDAAKAKIWLQKAADLGHEAAKSAIKSMEQQNEPMPAEPH